MNELKRHRRSDKIKWIFFTIVTFVLIIFVCGLVLQVFGSESLKPSNWFVEAEENSAGEEINTYTFYLLEANSEGVYSEFLSCPDFQKTEITTISATLNGENITLKRFTQDGITGFSDTGTTECRVCFYGAFEEKEFVCVLFSVEPSVIVMKIPLKIEIIDFINSGDNAGVPDDSNQDDSESSGEDLENQNICELITNKTSLEGSVTLVYDFSSEELLTFSGEVDWSKNPAIELVREKVEDDYFDTGALRFYITDYLQGSPYGNIGIKILIGDGDDNYKEFEYSNHCISGYRFDGNNPTRINNLALYGYIAHQQWTSPSCWIEKFFNPTTGEYIGASISVPLYFIADIRVIIETNYTEEV